MADDMGFSDIGCYGGEIETPNLDRLAEEGLRFTQFYNAARCCPTRAALLTGIYPHEAGMGGMVKTPRVHEENQAYQRYLNENCVTLAEVLKMAGYYTAMSGKWHVGEERPHLPTDRGFDNYYGLISGGMNYWDISRGKRPGIKRHFAIDSTEYLPPNEGFYLTDAITENAVNFIKKAGERNQPFFLYVAYTAPHWPAKISNKVGLTAQPGHIVDIMATCCELAETKYPLTFNGNEITSLRGKSLAPIFNGEIRKSHDIIFWEHEGNRAVRMGNWKIVGKKGQSWELYNMNTDRTELSNLANDSTELLNMLVEKYQEWAAAVNVIQ